MIYIFHGFGSSATTSSTVNALYTHIDSKLQIKPINYPYWNPLECENVVTRQIDPDDTEMIFIGVSLGGFWARYFANKYPGSKLILINPSLLAHKNASKYIGDVVLGKHTITNDYPAQLEPFAIIKDDPTLAIAVIVSTDDEVVDPIHTMNVYNGRARVHVTRGGHQLKLDPTLMGHINIAINTIVG